MDEVVIRYFCQRILKIFGIPNRSTAKLKRRWRVAATAVAYYRRFYSNRNVIDYDPRLLMVCCIFLAGKLEEHYNKFVHLKELADICNPYTQKEVLDMEVVLIEGLDFQLDISHPLNCVNSLIADWKHQAESKHIVDKASLSSLVQDWISNAEYILFDLQTTKAIVELKPLSCAVCALLVTEALPAELKVQCSLSSFLVGKFGESEAVSILSQVETAVGYVDEAQTEIDMNALYQYMTEIKPLSNWGRKVQTSNI